MDLNNQACLAALSILHGTTCARLLRAYGRTEDAANLDSALHTLVGILGREVGEDALARAMDWASGEAWAGEQTGAGSRIPQ